MNTSEFDQLIREFEILPKNISETTFMNICKHSGSRFEEICSRILAFYLQPSNEHGLKDLVLSSFFELIPNTNPFNAYHERISVEREAYKEGKFLDILVTGKYFALGIENKIGAEVYNPLHIYKKLLREKHENNYGVVLSVRKIEKENERKNIAENGFKILSYEDLFRVVKDKLGRYYSNANSKYVTFLFDFIKTIEDMSISTFFEDPQSKFFFDHSGKIEVLIDQFNNHTNRVLDVRKSNIATLKDKISSKSGVEWWAWEGWDLGYSEFDKTMPRIGVEASYETHNYDPLQKFRIFITTWNLADWRFYEEDVLKKYSGEKYPLDTTDNRARLLVDVVENNHQESIVEKLYEYYTFLSELVEYKKLNK